MKYLADKRINRTEFQLFIIRKKGSTEEFQVFNLLIKMARSRPLLDIKEYSLVLEKRKCLLIYELNSLYQGFLVSVYSNTFLKCIKRFKYIAQFKTHRYRIHILLRVFLRKEEILSFQGGIALEISSVSPGCGSML